MSGYKQAIALARSFFGRKFRASYVEPATVQEGETHLVCIGEVTQINYRAHGDNYERAHAFKKPRPHLYVTGDGKLACVMGGRWKFTGAGFEP